MATTRKQIDAPPERVWAVLADPDNYAHWVDGSRDVRDADPSFPAQGASFHHTFAFGPIDLRDETEVVESDAPRRLVLHGWPRESIPSRGPPAPRGTTRAAGRTASRSGRGADDPGRRGSGARGELRERVVA